MVRAPAFRQFWDQVRPSDPELDIDLDRVAGLILGQADAGQEFKANIISGAFDADKLDYFARDAFYTGIKVELDTERILHSIAIRDQPTGSRILVVRRPGVPHVEQILFGRTMLFSSIYHHHKVRAVECMVR